MTVQPPAEPTQAATSRALRYWPWAVACIALLFLAYAAAGFWLAPRIIDKQAKAWASENLGLDLAIEKIRVNPFTFEIDLDGIALPAQNPMVSARHVGLNFAATTLFSESRRFDSVVIEAPSIAAIIQQDGRLNLLKLVPPPSPDPMPSILIRDLRVTDGKALLADHSRAERPQTLLSPVAFHLENLHTTRDEGGGFQLQGRSSRDETFLWRGNISLAPIASSGSLQLRAISAAGVDEFAGHTLPIKLSDGRLNADLKYAASYGDNGLKADATISKLNAKGVEVSAGPAILNADIGVGALALDTVRLNASMPSGGQLAYGASLGGLSIRNVILEGTGTAKDEKATLNEMTLGGINLGPDLSLASIAIIRLVGLNAETSRDARGNIGLMKLMPASTAAPGKAATAPPRIGTLDISDASIRLTDRAVKPTSVWHLHPLNVTGTPAGPNGLLKLSADGRLNKGTVFSANGTLRPTNNPEADLAVRLSGFPIKAAIPYSIDFPALEIVRGTAAAQGRLGYRNSTPSYRGSATIDDLKLVETYGRTDLLAWKQLRLDGIDASPKRVRIASAELNAPYSTLVVHADGTMNLQRLVTMNPEPVVTPAANAEAPPKLTRAQRRAEAKRVEALKQQQAALARAKLAAPTSEPTIPIALDRLVVRGGTLDFADYSLRPNFAARIQQMGGTVQNISNSPRGIARMKLDGFVIDKYSPVSIAGELNPLQYDRHTNVDMAFRNIELPVFNPYSGRYAGYAIAKGKLTTELGYKIDNRALNATHHIVIEQLEWGAATDSKDKVPMPLKFVTSLLKDKDGVISLDVPVQGTLDDPTFKIGPIVWKIIGNLFEKALTAPFRALGGLFGDKEDVQFIDFAPGSALIPPTAGENLAAIAKGLGEKPELRLEIPNGKTTPADALAIADGKIAMAALKRDAKKDEKADLSTLELSRRHDRLQDLYKAINKKSPDYSEGPKDEERDQRREREVLWLMTELRKPFGATAEEEAALSKARAEAVRLALLESGGVDAARIFLSGGDSVVDHKGLSRMELKLDGG